MQNYRQCLSISPILLGVVAALFVFLVSPQPVQADAAILLQSDFVPGTGNPMKAYQFDGVDWENPDDNPLTVVSDDGWQFTVQPGERLKRTDLTSPTKAKIVNWSVKDHPELKGQLEVFDPLAVSDIGTNSFKLTWGKATPPAGESIKRYDIYILPQTANSPPDKTVDANTTSYTFTGVRSDRSFKIYVLAYYGPTIYDNYTTQFVSFKTKPFPPTKPSGVTAAVQSSKVTIGWKASSFDPTSQTNSYIIYRNDKQIGTSTTTSYSDTGIANGSYTYRVKAKDQYDVMSDQSDSVTAQVGATAASSAAPTTTATSSPVVTPEASSSPSPEPSPIVEVKPSRNSLPLWIIASIVVILAGVGYLFRRYLVKIFRRKTDQI